MDNYVKRSEVDTPAQGALFQARDGKKYAFKYIRLLRDRIKNEPLGGNRGNLRIQLIKAQDNHNEYLRMERQALELIEERANQLGQTTKKG